MSMIRNKFDKLISMSRKRRVFCLICLFVLVGMLSLLEFTQLSLPLTQHNNGLLSHDVVLGSMFFIWMPGMAFAVNYFLFEFCVTSNKHVFRQIVIDNAGSVLLIIGLVMWLSFVLMIYLYTGMICLVFNNFCIAFQ